MTLLAAKLNHMVNSLLLDKTFAALADPTRRAMLEQLAQGSSSVTDLAKPFSMSLPAVSKHLRVLEDAGLVASEKRGRTRHCELIAEPLTDADAWIERCQQFWHAQFEGLTEYLDNENAEAS